MVFGRLIKMTGREIRSYFTRNYPHIDCSKLSITSTVAAKEIRHLEELVTSIVKPGFSALEIGSWRGMSAIAIATILKNYPDTKLVCVDTWEMYQGTDASRMWVREGRPDICRDFIQNIEALELTPWIEMLKGRSEYIIPTLSSSAQFDFAFIDGNHSLEYVQRDSLNTWPLIKEGGIMCGHDYSRKHPDVIKVIDQHFPQKSVTPSIWSVKKEISVDGRRGE